MYKKVYVEITNSCNLSCEFCTLKKKNDFMEIDKFEEILAKLKGHTEYLYFHVLGEPLLHPNINELIDIASNNYKVNITTNGYLIKRIINNKNIRQLNISLHSFDIKANLSIDEYLSNIFEAVDTLKTTTYISFRIWANSPHTKYFISKINEHYQSEIDYQNIKNNSTICDSVFISTHELFTWPDLTNDTCNKKGKCYALRDHIGILVNGCVIPCCLDGSGLINLGNIYESTLEEIISSPRYQQMLNGFKNKERTEHLCQHCDFIK